MVKKTQFLFKVFSVVFAMHLQCCTCHYVFIDSATQMAIEENQFTIDVRVSPNNEEITMSGFSKYSSAKWVKDTISTVHFKEKKLYFDNGTILEKQARYDPYFKKNEEYYTCENISKLVKRNKHINLKLVYDVDSLGKITHYEKEYQAIRKKSCHAHIGVH